MNGFIPSSRLELQGFNSLQDLGQYDLLYPERRYLLAALLSQIEIATDILQKIAPLQQAIVSNEQPHLRRSLKKKLGWLRCRAREATAQEKAIVTQLNQINQEIQSRERFKQFQIEQQQQHYQPFSDPQKIDIKIHRTEFARLNPLSTEFVPRIHTVPYLNRVGQPQHRYSRLVPYINGSAILPWPGYSSMNEPFELSKDEPLRYYRPRASRPPICKRRSSSMDDGKPAMTPYIPTHKTQSLPSTPTIEEGNEKQAAQASRGRKELGYFDLPIRI